MISISVSFLGFLIIKFEFEEIFRDFGLSEDFFLKVIIVCAVLILFLLKSFFHQPFYNWISIVIIYFLVYFFPIFLKWKFEKEIKDEFIIFLDKVYLNLQSGMPLKASMAKASDEFNGWKKNQIKYIITSVFLGQENKQFQSKILQKFQKELSKIEKSKIKTLEQIKSLRECLKMEQNIRHRSRQVTMNLKIQSVVMTIMYFLIAIFISSQFEMKNSKLILFVSFLFFATGLVLTFLIGKGMKWKT
ncbi:MAG: type II secretion system F family protein [Bdellovibrionaceae bacterium]|nr:type II secretion system F family protein [Pseudobdellovibrionaceae bacterium]NUM59961.1 type II secretion system F family protein [Pseudobdellovibrionaceae bacterium]